MQILEYKENGKAKFYINIDMIVSYEKFGHGDIEGTVVNLIDGTDYHLRVPVDDFTRTLYKDILGMLSLESKN